MTDTLARLTAWRPSMTAYHEHQSISSGFLGKAHSRYGEGLSAALHERQEWLAELAAARAAGFQKIPATAPLLAKGAALHAWIEDDKAAIIRRAPPEVKVRRGKRWEAALRSALEDGADALLLTSELEELFYAWSSLILADTEAKREILAILRRWSPRVPEVSHLWSPFEGCWCRIREDLMARAPSGMWGAFQIKTTSQPLTPGRWWPFWRRWYLRSSALYREGLRDLMAGEPFRQFLIVARLEAPYPWALFDLEDRAEEIETAWRDDVAPELENITSALAAGRCYGPEEKGLFS